jgi:hypothetical protein
MSISVNDLGISIRAADALSVNGQKRFAQMCAAHVEHIYAEVFPDDERVSACNEALVSYVDRQINSDAMDDFYWSAVSAGQDAIFLELFGSSSESEETKHSYRVANRAINAATWAASFAITGARDSQRLVSISRFSIAASKDPAAELAWQVQAIEGLLLTGDNSSVGDDRGGSALRYRSSSSGGTDWFLTSSSSGVI